MRGNEHRSGELQLILELEDLQSSLLFCEVTGGDSPKKAKQAFYSSLIRKQKTVRYPALTFNFNHLVSILASFKFHHHSSGPSLIAGFIFTLTDGCGVAVHFVI